MAFTTEPLTPDEIVSPEDLARARLFTPFVAQVAAAGTDVPPVRPAWPADAGEAVTAYETGEAPHAAPGRVVARNL